MTKKFLAFPPAHIQRIAPEKFIIKDIRGAEFETTPVALATYLLSYGESDAEKIYNKVGGFFIINRERVKSIVDKLLNEEFLVKIKYKPEDLFNARKIIDNIFSPFKGKESISLSFLGISVGHECPYSCQGCYRSQKLDLETELEIKYIGRVIRDVFHLGGKSIAITGGEPTHPKLIERTKKIAELAKEEGLDVNLTTAGYALFEHIDDLEKTLCGVQISLDGFKNYHNSYRGHPEAFDRAIESIRVCHEREIPVMVNCTITEDNFSQLKGLGDYLRNNFKGVVLRFSPIIPKGVGKRYCTKDFAGFVERTFHRVMELKSIEGQQGFTFSPNKMVCFAGMSMAYIREDGVVFPCAFIEESIGNVKNTSFYELWQSPKLEEFRGKRTKNESAQKIPFSCFALSDILDKSSIEA